MTNEKVNSSKCCSKYVEEIKNLKNSLAKFSIGKNNLDVILRNQRCIFDKAGIGNKPKKQQKFYKNSFLSHKNTILLSLHVSIVEEKGMEHLHVILRKIAILK